MPKVLNKRIDNIPADAVYVGRPSKWGNPYILNEDGTREEVVEKYRLFIYQKLIDMELDINELKDHDLICWCAPLKCHADVLLEIANAR